MRADSLHKTLLVLASSFFALSLGLGAYLFARHARMRVLEGNLLTREQFQVSLLKNGPRGVCLMPHMSSEIAFVLDPARKRCNLWTNADQIYQINSLGLRGSEIGPKRPGTKRVVIVGDSWPWGQKLHDRDILAAQLQRRVDAASPGNFEFVTVAMPGWNTRSEAAFLRAHSHVLAPDVLIWLVSQNDANDTMGAVSPGVGSIALSPQVEERAPIMHLSRHSRWPIMYWYTTCPMPYVAGRWLHNLELIQKTRDFFQVPVLVIFAGLDEHYLAYLARSMRIDFPVLFEPIEIDGDDRWAVNEHDGHPSVWGVGMQSLPILDGMSVLGLDTGVELTSEEQQLVSLWRPPGGRLPSEDVVDSWLEEYVAGVPDSYHADRAEEAPGSGVGDSGEMADNGVLYLRAEPGRDHLHVELDLVEERPIARSLVFGITSFEGGKTEHRLELNESHVSTRIPMPARSSRFPLIELRWRFDSLRCQGPLSCRSANLVRVESAS